MRNVLWQITLDQLKLELKEILHEARRALSVDQIIHQLYHRRDRLGDLMHDSRDTVRHTQRLRLEIVMYLNSGVADRTQVEGEVYYHLPENHDPAAIYRSDPPRMHRSSRLSTLLSSFKRKRID